MEHRPRGAGAQGLMGWRRACRRAPPMVHDGVAGGTAAGDNGRAKAVRPLRM